MAVMGSLIQYVIIFVILAGVAVLGIFFGKTLRSRSDAKKAAENGRQEEK